MAQEDPSMAQKDPFFNDRAPFRVAKKHPNNVDVKIKRDTIVEALENSIEKK